MNRGFIYILSNPSFKENLYKIGKSKNDPKSFRSKDLSNSSSIPEPFKVEYQAFVEDYEKIEKRIHKLFESSRNNKKREFFYIDPEVVSDKIREIATVIHEETCYSKNLSEDKFFEALKRGQEMADREAVYKVALSLELYEWKKVENTERQMMLKKLREPKNEFEEGLVDFIDAIFKNG